MVLTVQDLDMYCEQTNTPAMARTSNLNEELGQVRQHVNFFIIFFNYKFARHNVWGVESKKGVSIQ